MPDALQAADLPEMSERSYLSFSEYITRSLGIRMDKDKRTMLQGRLAKRLKELNLASLDLYRDLLFDPVHGEAEQAEFINLVTTNKTNFFREASHFDFLAKTVLPGLSRMHCRVWSAGCSTGEEVYSLAMTLAEHEGRHPGFQYSILGTDVSTRVLAKAEAAVYGEGDIEPVPVAMRHKYLLRSTDRSRQLVKISRPLREHTSFRRLNFMDADFGSLGHFDIIFFRNVMIYYGRETQQRVLDAMCSCLARGAHLFVGHTESLVGIRLPLQQVSQSVYRKP